MDAIMLAKTIDSAGLTRTDQYDSGDSFAIELTRELKSMGWVDAKRYDWCSKASFESYLEKKGVKVRIITACFFGVFTQVEVRGNAKVGKNVSISFITEGAMFDIVWVAESERDTYLVKVTWLNSQVERFITPLTYDTPTKILEYHKNKMLERLNKNYEVNNEIYGSLFRGRLYDFNIPNAIKIMVE